MADYGCDWRGWSQPRGPDYRDVPPPNQQHRYQQYPNAPYNTYDYGYGYGYEASWGSTGPQHSYQQDAYVDYDRYQARYSQGPIIYPTLDAPLEPLTKPNQRRASSSKKKEGDKEAKGSRMAKWKLLVLDEEDEDPDAPPKLMDRIERQFDKMNVGFLNRRSNLRGGGSDDYGPGPTRGPSWTAYGPTARGPSPYMHRGYGPPGRGDFHGQYPVYSRSLGYGRLSGVRPQKSQQRQRGGNKREVKPANKADDIALKEIPEGTAFQELSISPDNIYCFNGFQSILTIQHAQPVLIGEKIYESCEHFYQIEKVRALCGDVRAELTATIRDDKGNHLDGGKNGARPNARSFSMLAKEQIRDKKLDRKTIDEWRVTKGMEVMQRALHAKLAQNDDMRKVLSETGTKLLVHSFAGDAIYGAGVSAEDVKEWVKKKQGEKIRVPALFPMTPLAAEWCPVVAKGRNLLGVILMQLRAELNAGRVPKKDVDVNTDSLRVSTPPEQMNAVEAINKQQTTSSDDFSIGGGSFQLSIKQPDT